MFAKVEIETDEDGRTRVYINGAEMSRITKIEFVHEAECVPVVRLEFAPESVTIDSEAKIPIDPPGRAAETAMNEQNARCD